MNHKHKSESVTTACYIFFLPAELVANKELSPTLVSQRYYTLILSCLLTTLQLFLSTTRQDGAENQERMKNVIGWLT